MKNVLHEETRSKRFFLKNFDQKTSEINIKAETLSSSHSFNVGLADRKISFKNFSTNLIFPIGEIGIETNINDEHNFVIKPNLSKINTDLEASYLKSHGKYSTSLKIVKKIEWADIGLFIGQNYPILSFSIPNLYLSSIFPIIPGNTTFSLETIFKGCNSNSLNISTCFMTKFLKHKIGFSFENPNSIFVKYALKSKYTVLGSTYSNKNNFKNSKQFVEIRYKNLSSMLEKDKRSFYSYSYFKFHPLFQIGAGFSINYNQKLNHYFTNQYQFLIKGEKIKKFGYMAGFSPSHIFLGLSFQKDLFNLSLKCALSPLEYVNVNHN